MSQVISEIVNSKYYGGTHIARCGTGKGAVRGSSTNCNENAAQLAAEKWFRAQGVTGEVTLHQRPTPAKGWQATYVAQVILP